MDERKREWPEKGDLVICTVKNVQNFGAFVSLDEYDGKEGLIHISEIAHGWVRNIREFIREGQRVVCKVLHVDARRGHIDLSLRRVGEEEKRRKIREWKDEAAAKKWLSLAASQSGMQEEEVKRIEECMKATYGSLREAFEEIVRGGKEVLHRMNIAEEHVNAIYDVAVANVKLPSVRISGFVELRCTKPDGIEILKEALINAEKTVSTKYEDVNAECIYVGAPRYEIRITAPDYKKAESALRDAAKKAIEIIKQNNGEGEFFRTADGKSTKA